MLQPLAACVSSIAFGMYGRDTDDGIKSESLWVENLHEREIITLTCFGNNVRLNVTCAGTHTYASTGLQAIQEFLGLVDDLAAEDAPEIITQAMDWSKTHYTAVYRALNIS